MSDVRIVVGKTATVHSHEFDMDGHSTLSTISWQSMDANTFTVESVSDDRQTAVLRATGQAGYSAILHLTADSNGFAKNFTVELIAAPVADITITQE